MTFSSAVLAFGNSNGDIYVYDFNSLNIISQINETNLCINLLNWIKVSGSKTYQILFLSDKCTFVLWDFTNSTILWKHKTDEEINSFYLNPNDNSKLVGKKLKKLNVFI